MQATTRIQQVRVVHLCPIVVLRGTPEYGQDGDSKLRFEVLGESDGGKSLVNCEERAGEEPGLLPGGDDRAASGDEAFQPLPRAIGGRCDCSGDAVQEGQMAALLMAGMIRGFSRAEALYCCSN